MLYQHFFLGVINSLHLFGDIDHRAVQLQRVNLGAIELSHHVRRALHVLFKQGLRLKLFDKQIKYIRTGNFNVHIKHLQRHHHLAQRTPLRLFRWRNDRFTGPFLRYQEGDCRADQCKCKHNGNDAFFCCQQDVQQTQEIYFFSAHRRGA